MHLTIDDETRSECNLKLTGGWVYSQHPTTEIICKALKVEDQQPKIWINPYFVDIMDHHAYLKWQEFKKRYLISYADTIRLLDQASIIEAHNVFFEKGIYENVLFDWPEIPEHKWRCSMAKACSFALPRSLDEATKALGLTERKDKEGYFTMMKLCKPRKPTKKDPNCWNEGPEDLLTLFKYNLQDVEAEYGLSCALRDLSTREQKIWSVDQIINKRGLYVDVPAAQAAIDMVEEHKTKLKVEFLKLTGGAVGSPTQVAATLEWLKGRGVELPDLTKTTVTKTLEGIHPGDVRRALEIRQSLSKSSTAKFKRMVDGAGPDQRMRGTTLYHGASTGRWAGQLIQPHNMVRKMPDDYEGIISMLKAKNLELMELLYGDVMAALSGSSRAFLMAAPGKELICADYSSIEGRVLAWLAEEDYIVQNYFDGKDAYCVFAAQATGLDYHTIRQGYMGAIKEYEQIRFEGKTGELACGYQGGEAAIKRFAPDMPLDRRKEIVSLWRDNRPMTVKFWADMEKYAKSAILTGKTYTWNRIKWGMANNFLHCKLPSGRLLSYYRPELRMKKTPWGQDKSTISFMGVNSETKKWERQYTYGGKLVENIVQAVARDILAEALVRLEATGRYPVVLHVHDEAASEVDEGSGSVKEYCEIMSKVPEWAIGCPIAAEGFRTKRYHK